MIKGIITICCLLLLHCVFAQKNVYTKSEQAALDSILRDDEFIQMFRKSLEPESYVEASISAGNNYLSEKNKHISASQLENKFVVAPSLAYMHKSGFGISASASLASSNGRTGFYQFSITPSYTIVKSKKVYGAFSYTRILSSDMYEDAVSPITNDLYATAYLQDPWLQPGISIGFSSGKRTTYHLIDTFLLGVRRVFTDTIRSSVKAFSLNAFVQHSFEFYELLNKQDGIAVSPKVIFNAGSNRYKEDHYNPFVRFVQKNTRRKNFGRLQNNTSFEFQSIAFDLDINYIIGKFGLEPQAYLDYYFPDTTDKRLTCVYSFMISYAF